MLVSLVEILLYDYFMMQRSFVESKLFLRVDVEGNSSRRFLAVFLEEI